jgi:heat shock protein HslJ
MEDFIMLVPNQIRDIIRPSRPSIYSFAGTFHPSDRLFIAFKLILRKNEMNKISLTVFTILVASGLILSACSASADLASLGGTSWTLISYGNLNHQAQAAAGIQTSLIFSADGQVSGNLGCNSLSGNYQVKDGKLVFSPLASTLMACPDPQMTQEGSAFRVLTGTVRFLLSGNTLTTYDVSGTSALTLSRVDK